MPMLKTPDDHLAIGRVQLNTDSTFAESLCDEQGCAGSGKRVEHDLRDAFRVTGALRLPSERVMNVRCVLLGFGLP